MPDSHSPGQRQPKTATSSAASTDGPAPSTGAHAPSTGGRAPSTGAHAPSVSGAPGAPAILVVDDDDDIRAMLVRALGTKYTVYEARDGLAACETLEHIPPPEAIVTDVMMPRLDGIAFAKLVRKDAALQRIPILFLTARGSPVDVITGINAGARHYVTKPFKIGDILAKVATMIGKR